jgi:hypothetical protein
MIGAIKLQKLFHKNCRFLAQNELDGVLKGMCIKELIHILKPVQVI